MKIVYCIPQLWLCGGMERVLTIKANYLANNDYDVCFITTCQAGKEPYFPLNKNIKLYDLGINYPKIFKHKSILYRKCAYQWQQRKHKKALAQLLHKLKADIVISTFEDEANFITDIKDGSHKLLEYHFSKLKRLQYGRTGFLRKIDEWRTKQDEKIIKKFDAFIVLTKEDAELWGKQKHIHVIPNPLSIDNQEVASLNHKRVIAVGRLEFQKNFETLIHIWTKVAPSFPDWHLDIYGNGQLRDKLQAQINNLGLTKSLTLQQATQTIQEEYLRSSIYVMTSYYEGLPMVLLEAQAMGLPIISYACPSGPSDVITDSEDGYLINLNDEETFAKRLKHLMSDEGLRKEMGLKAKENSKRYEIDRVMGEWIRLFEELSKK